MDTRGPVTRASKALAFLENEPSDPYRLFPWPWRSPAAPYYLVEGLENRDGRGGYSSTCRFDDQGLPYVVGRDGGRVYNPLVIARYVLRMWSLGGLTPAATAFATAERGAMALVRSGAATGIWGPGRSPHEMSAATPSCIVQAFAISALVRVASRNPCLVPDRVLGRAVEALVAPVGAGGTVTHDLGGPFFEEFESRSHVLNGCVYGLWALYDLIDGAGFSDLIPLARSIESGLAGLAPTFTTAQGWSLYALNTYGYAPLASAHYHRSHIRMFTLLNARTGRAAFGDAVERWNRALESRSVKCLVLARKCAQVMWMRDVRRLPLAKSIWE
jgi:hypothetical protein